MQGLTQALITVATNSDSPTNPNPNLTNSTYPPPHDPTLSALHLYPVFYPLPPPHARILPNANKRLNMCYTQTRFGLTIGYI